MFHTDLINACLKWQLAICGMLWLGPLVGDLPSAEPRNLLIIQTDEHHFNTLGCYGGTVVGTPNIDWIAKNGALCNSFYATTPVCSPSRASLVTGLYPQKTPVTTNNIPLSQSMVTFAELLRRQGYATDMQANGTLMATANLSGRPSVILVSSTTGSCLIVATGKNSSTLPTVRR